MKLKSKFGFMSVMFLGFASYVGMAGLIIPYLIEKGFSAVERGGLLAISALFSILLQFLVGYLSDRYKTTKRFFIILTALFGISALLTFTFNGSFLFYYSMTLLSNGFVRSVSNIVETWVLEVDELYDDFGFIRSFGSLGWAFFSLLLGYLTQKQGFGILGIVSFVLSLGVVWISCYLPDANKMATLDVNLKDIKTLFHSKRFVTLLVVYLITYIVYNADSITVVDYMIEIGGTSFTIGLKNFVLALAEIPLLFLAGKFILKYKSHRLMIFASIVLSIKFVLYSVTTQPMGIVWIGILQAVTFPFILVTQKDLVFQEVPTHLRATGQLVSIALTLSLSAIITPLLSGLLIEYLSTAQVIFWLGILMLVPAGLMMKYPNIT